MTVVCAPAGSGKTVLLQSWVADLEAPVAWVTVERGERDAQRFWLQVIDSLADAVGADAVERISPAPSLSGPQVVEQLVAQLKRLERPLVLVIDDLQELESEDALSWLEFLLARLPEQLRVVLVTREEPALGLHRLRLAGRLTELRATDLRFSVAETRALLGASGIGLSEEGVALLHDRTEGWPAGLRLATLSMSAHPDPERFVSEFSGSERTVAGYLLSEVLERQTPRVRNLLLRTSILERVSGPLADQLVGSTGSEAILQRLEDQNAFVSSLDTARTWFRYHHLFGDLLRLELRRAEPAAIPSLHLAAARWHDSEGDVLDAVHHYQSAGEWAPAARLLVDNYLALTMAGRGETLHALLKEFPASQRMVDGNLAVALGIDNILHGLLEEAAANLAAARALAGSLAPERRRLFEAYLAVVGLEFARRRCDLAMAREAMGFLGARPDAATNENQLPVGPEHRALGLMNLGIVELWAGNQGAARLHLEDALERAQRISRPFIEVGCHAHLAMTAPLGGQPLPLALDLSEGALAIAEKHGWSGQSMTTGAFVIAGMTLVWMGYPAQAEQHLSRAEALLRVAADPGSEVVLHHARGMLRFGQGRFDEALAEFAREQALQRLLASEHVFASEARDRALQVWVRMGDVESARAELAGASVQNAALHIALAALALEDDDPARAVEALAPVIDGSASALYARCARVEALVLDATARQRLGEPRAAERSLEHALDLAERDALILPFMLWPSRGQLESHPRHRSAHGVFIATILDALAAGAAPPRRVVAPLHDELSEAELRVIRYLPTNLTASEIGAELVVSANTVRTHMRHIYAKLDAHTRSEAVARGRELGLLAPGGMRR